MQRWPGHRGPRSATYTAILLAGLELDTASDKIDYPALSRAVFDGRGTRGTRGTHGAVAKLTRDGDTVQILFEKKTKQVPECTDYHRNNRIVQIRRDGTLVYESSCGGYKMVSVDVTPPPMTVNARYTTGLTVGTRVAVTDDVVVAAWKKDGKVPSMIIGVVRK